MNKQISRRARKRLQDSFPFGIYAALITAAAVTLLGVLLGLDSFVILLRASVSAAIVGAVVSMGVGFVRIVLAESKNRSRRPPKPNTPNV